MQKTITRYSRQVLFPGIGEEGQRRLLVSKVVIIGCGALGTVQANALARAGVGKLTIVDRDFVEENNLQRQVLFDEEDVRKKLPKVVAAQNKLNQINSEITIESRVTDVNAKNIEEIIQGADLVLDGVDNFETRFLLNDACVKHGIPWVYGACIGSYGITMSIVPNETPCVRCVFESAPPPGLTPTCDTAGIISSAVNLVASIQVSEAFKILTGQLQKIQRGLVVFDLWENMFKTLEVKDTKFENKCPTCVLNRYDYLDVNKNSATYASSLCGRNAVQIVKNDIGEISFKDLSDKLKPISKPRSNGYIFSFSIDEFDISLFKDGRAIIKGTNDPSVARGVYAKYIGS